MTRIAACFALLLAASMAFADSGDADSGDTDSNGVAVGAAQLAGDEGGPAACGCVTAQLGSAWLLLPGVVVPLRRRLRRRSGPAAP